MTHYKTAQHAMLEAYGPSGSMLVNARWAPSGAATQTLLEAAGINAVTRNSAGLWTVSFMRKPRELIDVHLTPVYSDGATLYHRLFVNAEYDPVAGTIQIGHRSVAVASVASGDAASDTIAGVRFTAIARFNA